MKKTLKKCNVLLGDLLQKVYRQIDMYDYLFFRKTSYPHSAALISATCAYIKKGVKEWILS